MRGKSIKNLKGIEAFTSLTSLICSYNQLTTLDVSKNTQLTRLVCESNQLTTLNISNNTKLTKLRCSWNKLTTLNVSKKTKLTNLSCAWNKLTTLNVSNNTQLTELRCYSNKLTTLDVSKNTLLTELECNSNKLTTLDVSKNTLLTWLRCYSNQLTTLDVSSNTKLTFLSCTTNKLTTLDVTKNTKLTSIKCGENQLTTLNVSKNTKLTWLGCGDNQLRAINLKNGNNKNLKYFWAKGNPQLTCLRVDDATAFKKEWGDSVDQPKAISSECIKSETNVAIPDPNFKKALLANSSINTNSDANISYAEAKAYSGSIYVSSKNIENLKGIEAFTAVTSLHCNENKLTTLDLSKNTQLTGLGCHKNQLTTLDISKNTKLDILYCYQNKLTKLDVSKNTQLTWLKCHDNQLLKAINLKNGNNKNLKVFDARKNPQLICLEVDDPTAFKKKWGKKVDKPSVISNDCMKLVTNISNSSNTQNHLLDDLEIFPNPTQDRLSIETSLNIRKITITDLAGKVLKTIDGNRQSIDVSTLHPNIYLLRLSTDKGITYRKFLKE